jgi:hypothetical protein
MRELRSAVATLAVLLAFAAVVLLMIRAVHVAPWAWPLILLSPAAAVLVLLPIWRRRRPNERAAIAPAGPADDPYVKRRISPNGRFVAVTAANEVKMSHWIETLTVLVVAGGRSVLDLDHPWSAEDVRWDDDNHLHFAARCYPGDAPAVTIDAELETRTALVRAPSAGTKITFAELPAWLDDYYRRNRRAG